MPQIFIPLPESHLSIARPVAFRVMEQIQKITGVGADQIYFPDTDATPTRNIDTKHSNFLRTESTRRIVLTLSETPDPEYLYPLRTEQHHEPAMFEDGLLRTRLQTVYHQHNATLTIRYSGQSRNEVQAWIRTLSYRLASYKEVNWHVVEYFYLYHAWVLDAIETIYARREAQGGYGETFDRYWKTHASNRADVVTNVGGRTRAIGVKERQSLILGTFGFQKEIPTMEKSRETGLWEIEYPYQFSYRKPIGSLFQYPLLVHNQPLPLEWLDFVKEPLPHRQLPRTLTKSQVAEYTLRSDIVGETMEQDNELLRIPSFDDQELRAYAPHTQGILEALVALKPSDLRTLVKLGDLGEAAIDSEVLAFLKASETPHLLNYRASIFYLTVYEEAFPMAADRFEVLEDLTIRSKEDLSIRKVYHVRLAVVTAIDYLTQGAIDRVRRQPSVLYKILMALNAAVRVNPDLQPLRMLQTVDSCTLNAVYRQFLRLEQAVKFTTLSAEDLKVLELYGVDEACMRRLVSQQNLSVQTTGILAYRVTKET